MALPVRFTFIPHTQKKNHIIHIIRWPYISKRSSNRLMFKYSCNYPFKKNQLASRRFGDGPLDNNQDMPDVEKICQVDQDISAEREENKKCIETLQPECDIKVS